VIHRPITCREITFPLGAFALELVQAAVNAAAAKDRRGDKGDGTMPGDDLAAAVEFVHLKGNIKG
jgi:hypothetical protein